MNCAPACPVVRFGLIPALITLPLIALRAWMEVNHPDTAKFVAVFPLSAAWIIVSTVLMLRSGVSFGSFLKTTAVFNVINRAGISAAYALAWAGRWTTPDGAPVRYVTQITRDLERPADSTAWEVFVFGAIPAVAFIVIAVLVWFIAWAIAFRGKRSPIKASTGVACA